ncbi:MAG: fluoride efflux transporter CrcB [Planctomycetes bacterium]|nr:fluoride efflux transporter CrcB [Planctomycetota bacterium]
MLVMLGGALGSGARYLIGLGAAAKLPGTFPFGTLCVNVLGSFALGMVAQIAMQNAAFSPDTRAFVAAGVLGGFTTYSSFNQETIDLVQAGALGQAVLYAVVTTTACLACGVAGMALARMFAAN